MLKEEFPGLKLYSLDDLDINTDCPEDGVTFIENAAAKSLFYSKLAGDMATMADDSGLVVEALNGEPGVHSARYASDECDERGAPAAEEKKKDSRRIIDQRNIEKLLRKLSSEENRAAKFVCEIVLSKNGKIIESFHGEVEGVILRQKRGSGGFGYDPVFYYPSLEKTFAQLTTEEKNKISHRADALQKLKDYLRLNQA